MWGLPGRSLPGNNLVGPVQAAALGRLTLLTFLCVTALSPMPSHVCIYSADACLREYRRGVVWVGEGRWSVAGVWWSEELRECLVDECVYGGMRSELGCVAGRWALWLSVCMALCLCNMKCAALWQVAAKQ